MGSACCVAARDKSVGTGSSSETQHRNIRHSPNWSFRWDHRGRVVGEEVSHSFSGGVSRNDRPELKYESSYASEEGSPLEHLRRQTWKKPVASEGNMREMRTPTSGNSISRNISMGLRLEQVNKATEYPTASFMSPAKVSLSIPSPSSLSTSPLSTPSHLPPTSLTSSRLSHRSPGHRLLRQVSGNHIPGHKSPKNYLVSEDRPAFPGINDSVRGSYGGSSDGWSVNAFSELMATSHRERWSFGSESFDLTREKIARSCSLFSASPSVDMQTCGICSMLLVEKSLFSSQKIIANSELSVIAVLTCGHVYHAECLESMTSEINKYDPACPICSFGEKQTLRLSEQALKGEIELKIRNRRFRNRVVDSDLDGDSTMFDPFVSSGQGKCPKLSSSSSLRGSSGRGFLRRRFSFGSKGTKAMPENHTAKRKGLLWSKSTKM